MDDATLRKRIWGWSFFDWAQQPFATLGLTFVFAPYFAAVASDLFLSQGASESAANASAQSLWSSAQTVSGLIIAFSAPFLGAWVDATGRRLPWIWVLSIITTVCAWSMWFVMPDGTGLMFGLLMFWVGFTAAESAFNLNNAALPSLGPMEKIGRISGNATSFGYWGGVIALFIMLLFLAENESGTTLIGLEPLFGLDPELREGTRSVGPFIAIWFAVFMIPFFLWSRDAKRPTETRPSSRQVVAELWATVRGLRQRRSLGAFLLGSMFYRDALTAMYSYGGIYATLVLEWEIIQVGVFGIVAAIAAAVMSWVGGIADERVGPKPVIVLCCLALIGVSAVIIGMSRESLFGVPLADGSAVPDIIFYICGAIIGGAGGALYSASRSMMTRHTNPDRPAEAFGLFALTGKATAFLAPALITVFTATTQSNQLGFLPVIFLFLLGLFLLRWVQPEGDRAV
jgi:UMF1 family MFS transporter